MQVVGPGTPAAEAGLKPGDVIKTFDGKPVADYRHRSKRLLAKTKPSQKVEIVVLRDGKESDARGDAPPPSAGSDQARGRRSALDAADVAAVRRPEDRRRWKRRNKDKWEAEDKERKKRTEAEEARAQGQPASRS